LARAAIGAALLGAAMLTIVALMWALPRPAVPERSDPAATAKATLRGIPEALPGAGPANVAHRMQPNGQHAGLRASSSATRDVPRPSGEDVSGTCERSTAAASGGGRVASRSAILHDAHHPEPDPGDAADDPSNGGSAMSSRTLPVIPIDGSTW
jgi:hypothetical protein